MPRYFLSIPGDDALWETKSEAQKRKVYAAHDRFHEALARGGHTVIATAPLTPASEAKVVRAGADGLPVVSDGPFAEVVEQVSGFYFVSTDDLDGLLTACEELAFDERCVEIRPAAEVED